MGSREGVLKVAAKRLEISYEAYLEKLHAGLKWCTTCKEFKADDNFAADKTRGDGRDAHCLECRHIKTYRLRRNNRPSVRIGNQASQAVRQAIKDRVLTAIETRLCKVCSAPAKHYHHHLGYHPDNFLRVIPLCISCHQRSHWEAAGE